MEMTCHMCDGRKLTRLEGLRIACPRFTKFNRKYIHRENIKIEHAISWLCSTNFPLWLWNPLPRCTLSGLNSSMSMILLVLSWQNFKIQNFVVNHVIQIFDEFHIWIAWFFHSGLSELGKALQLVFCMVFSTQAIAKLNLNQPSMHTITCQGCIKFNRKCIYVERPQNCVAVHWLKYRLESVVGCFI